MLGILAPNKLFLNSISVFTVYTELETLPITASYMQSEKPISSLLSKSRIILLFLSLSNPPPQVNTHLILKLQCILFLKV